MRATLSLLAVLWAFPFAAAAQLTTGEGADRWVPAAALHVGVRTQDGEAASSTSMVLGPAFDPDPQFVRPAESGSGALIGATVGASVELMSPALPIQGGPRLFAHVGIAGVLGSQKNLSREGSPAGFAVPPSAPFFMENAVLGQGSATQGETEPFLVRAGAGVSFSLPLLGRVIRIKPSVEYVREEIKLTGEVRRAVAQQANLFSLDDARLIVLSDSTSEDYHGIGPGIEVETDAVRAGNVVVSVFGGGQAYYFPGDLEVELSDTNAVGEAATWTYEKEDWGFHLGVGLRFRWLPE